MIIINNILSEGQKTYNKAFVNHRECEKNKRHRERGERTFRDITSNSVPNYIKPILKHVKIRKYNST